MLYFASSFYYDKNPRDRDFADNIAHTFVIAASSCQFYLVEALPNEHPNVRVYIVMSYIVKSYFYIFTL